MVIFAIRDGAEFAWVPQGDTCPFCLMLASNGWQNASRKTLKGDHAEHIHANCDCQFAIRFNGKPSYASYDPDKYKEIYNNAEGATWQEKLNSMRKAEYEANADKIRAQKREAYAKRTRLNESDKSDILEAAEKSRRHPGNDSRAIVSDTVATEQYAEKMKRLGESEKITNIITNQARKTLWRRNGTGFEDLVYINPKTGKVLAQRNQNIVGGVGPTDEMKKMILQNKRSIIALHNHPHSMLPSKADLINAKRYDYGIIACHNGRIIKYAVSDNANINLADVMLNTIQDSLDSGKDISISLRLLEEIGVKMEVIA